MLHPIEFNTLGMLKGPVSRAEVVGDRPEKMSATLLTCSQRWVYRLRALNYFQKKRLTPMWGNKREERKKTTISTTSSRKQKIATQRWDSFEDACARCVEGRGVCCEKNLLIPNLLEGRQNVLLPKSEMQLFLSAKSRK